MTAKHRQDYTPPDIDRINADLDSGADIDLPPPDVVADLPGGDGDGVPAGGLYSAFDADAAAASLPPVIDAASWLSSEPPKAEPVFNDMFDLGDKVCIIAGSKMRKSFFALQMASHLAGGLDFLDWDCDAARTVLVVQAEIRDSHYHRRVKRMIEAIGKIDIGHRLHIINGRGCDALSVEAVAGVAQRIGAQVIMFDPLYKFATGDENSAADMKPVLAAFDRLAQDTGAAVIYIHHDPKGDASERNIRDRGAGSGVLARDYDAAITLTAHRDNPDTAVIHVLLRNHPPRTEFCATWEDGRFQYDPDAACVTGKPGKYDAAIRTAIEKNPSGSLAEIATIVGCDRSTISRYKKRGGVA